MVCLVEAAREDTQEEQKLREWLARRLKRGDVPDALWRLLKSDGNVEQTLAGDISKDDLLDRAREFLRAFRDMGGSLDREQPREEPPDTSSYVPLPLPGDPVYERAYAAAPYLLKRLETLPAVKSFRRRLNAPLSREDAQELIRSPESARGSGPPRRARLFWDGKEAFGVDVEEGSLLWKLYDTVERLPPGPWQHERVAWWLLTGDAPEVQPLQAEIRLGAWPTVTLTVPAWATAGAVGEFHKETKDNAWAQAATSPEFQEEARRHAGIGDGFAPTPSPRRLAVFRFVAERGEFRNGTFEHSSGWRPLMELWNRRLPEGHEWRYTDVRNFSRDFRAAKRTLFGAA